MCFLKGTLYIHEVSNSGSANILLSPASEAGFVWQLISVPQRLLKKSPLLSSSPAAVWVPTEDAQRTNGTHPSTHLTSEKNVGKIAVSSEV